MYIGRDNFGTDLNDHFTINTHNGVWRAAFFYFCDFFDWNLHTKRRSYRFIFDILNAGISRFVSFDIYVIVLTIHLNFCKHRALIYRAKLHCNLACSEAKRAELLLVGN
ncbi:hypothetical protein D3C81_1434860 [compost metagenome]